MEYINPFDFKKVLMEYFLGSPEFFSFAFILLISFSCAKFGISNKIYFLLLTLSSLMFGLYLGNAILVLILFLVGYLSFKLIARLAS